MNLERELHEALVDAFSVERLEQMLRYQMSLELETISTEKDKEAIVASLVRTASIEGWLNGLLNAAYQANPGNKQLRSLMRYARLPQAATEIEMHHFDSQTSSEPSKQTLSDRVTGLEFTVYGNRGINGVVRSMQAMEQRLENMEALLQTRTSSPLGPRAAKALLALMVILTVLAAIDPGWALAMWAWRALQGGF
ncbi:MAG: effector-associated domain EAD1-containing protein [Caldilineaceae bacterium]